MKAFKFCADDIIEVARKFQVAPKFDLRTVQVIENKVGHLNATFILTSSEIQPGYVLQCVDHEVFKDISGLMANIETICSRLAASPIPGQVSPALIRTMSGATFVKHGQTYWRMFREVPGRVVERCTSPELAYRAAKAFAAFDCVLAQLSVKELVPTIPYFHDVPRRLKALDYVFGTDPTGRAGALSTERDFIDSLRARVNDIELGIQERRLPLRCVHHDTKINNLLFDLNTDQPICVVDYDTCMPGVVLSDVGDLARYSLSDTAEDERDISKIRVRPEYFEGISRGFIDGMGAVLLRSEVLMFPVGIMLRTFCDGIRFLTDHVQGDKYFKISRPGQNLDRARAHFEITRQLLVLEPTLQNQVEELSRLLPSSGRG